MTFVEPADRRGWVRKFRHAFRGVKQGVRGQSSFFVHFFAAAAVLVAAGVLSCTASEWCLLLLCIAGVLTAEMFNSALEAAARAINREQDPHLADALDIGSAAVLVASLGAAFVGGIIFGRRLGHTLGWW